LVVLASQERLLGDVTEFLGTPEPSFSDAFADELAPFAGIQSLLFVQGMRSEDVNARQIRISSGSKRICRSVLFGNRQTVEWDNRHITADLVVDASEHMRGTYAEHMRGDRRTSRNSNRLPLGWKNSCCLLK
jgi:hypothetical protein